MFNGIMQCSINECVTWCTLLAVRCNARQSRGSDMAHFIGQFECRAGLRATYYALTHTLFSPAASFIFALYTQPPSHPAKASPTYWPLH